jgi:hypothetical protein
MGCPDPNPLTVVACRLLRLHRIYANQMLHLWVVVALRRTVFLPQLAASAIHYLITTLALLQGTAMIPLPAPCHSPVACRI